MFKKIYRAITGIFGYNGQASQPSPRPKFKRLANIIKSKKTDPHREFWDSLSDSEKRLLEISNRQYGGSLDRMLEDTQQSHERCSNGEDLVYDQVEALEKTIFSLNKIMDYQNKNKVNLTELYLKNQKTAETSLS